MRIHIILALAVLLYTFCCLFLFGILQLLLPLDFTCHSKFISLNKKKAKNYTNGYRWIYCYFFRCHLFKQWKYTYTSKWNDKSWEKDENDILYIEFWQKLVFTMKMNLNKVKLFVQCISFLLAYVCFQNIVNIMQVSCNSHFTIFIVKLSIVNKICRNDDGILLYKSNESVMMSTANKIIWK